MLDLLRRYINVNLEEHTEDIELSREIYGKVSVYEESPIKFFLRGNEGLITIDLANLKTYVIPFEYEMHKNETIRPVKVYKPFLVDTSKIENLYENIENLKKDKFSLKVLLKLNESDYGINVENSIFYAEMFSLSYLEQKELKKEVKDLKYNSIHTIIDIETEGINSSRILDYTDKLQNLENMNKFVHKTLDTIVNDFNPLLKKLLVKNKDIVYTGHVNVKSSTVVRGNLIFSKYRNFDRKEVFKKTEKFLSTVKQVLLEISEHIESIKKHDNFKKQKVKFELDFNNTLRNFEFYFYEDTIKDEKYIDIYAKFSYYNEKNRVKNLLDFLFSDYKVKMEIAESKKYEHRDIHQFIRGTFFNFSVFSFKIHSLLKKLSSAKSTIDVFKTLYSELDSLIMNKLKNELEILNEENKIQMVQKIMKDLKEYSNLVFMYSDSLKNIKAFDEYDKFKVSTFKEKLLESLESNDYINEIQKSLNKITC